MNFVPLWIKTDYSILSSMIKIDDLIIKLKENNIKACAICDNNIFGAMEFYDKCKNNSIKPIIGIEINIPFTMLLYAKNYKGYQNLCNINTLISKEELSYDVLNRYLDNIVVIVPYEFMENISSYKLNADEVFIGYSSEEQKCGIKESKVYVKKTLTLDKESNKYLEYLYKIDDKKYDGKETSLEISLNEFDIKSTNIISELCNLEIPKRSDLLPKYNSDVHFDQDKYLTDLAIKGLRKRLDDKVSIKYLERLKYELNIINKMGFSNYFLVVWDYVKYAKKNNIMVGPGRGSAASSLVSYSLGITDIDPIKYDLLFERFLNPDRVTMPDIDIDFDAEKRDNVINYVVKKYGEDKVSGIITFSNLLAKQVVRDVSRILDISTTKVDYLVKNFDDKKDLRENLNNTYVKNILRDDVKLKVMYDIAMHLEGLKRHTSQHAAGIIISSKNLSDYIPIFKNSDGTYLSGYTMNYIEELGLLKMDFLGLKNLTIVSKILNKIGLKFSDISLDDKKTYKLFADGNLSSVFQFESTGMRNFIRELKPDNINDLIAAVSLFRPGPIDNIPHYIARKYNKEKITYINKDLEEILKPTYGIIIYQEQIMQIARKMAGFTYAEADVLRRAMSKKKEDVLLSEKEKFINGSLNKGYTNKDANDVYDLILKFANYGFNKAHSVSYAIIGYKIAYLKANYPQEFMCEILNSTISSSPKIKNIINECKLLGVKLEKSNINNCSLNYEVCDGKIRMPLSLINKISSLTAKYIVDERNENGLYSSYFDFVRRVYKIGKENIKYIVLSGALDIFGETRKTLIENLNEAINYAELCSDLDESLVIKPELKRYDEYLDSELTSQEESLYRFYISNHPTNMYISESSITTNKLERYFDKTVDIILYIDRKREITTKKGDKMMFLNGSDTYGNIEVIAFPKVYDKVFNLLVPGVYKIKGKVEKRFSNFQVILYDINKV